jgi:ArsR family metal-binding transcriptional regulator
VRVRRKLAATPLRNNMYLDAITLKNTLPCLAEPGKIIVIGTPSRSLSDALPYLATLPGVIAWNPHALTLTFRRQPGFMTLYPEKVYITQVKNTEEGLALLDALKDAVNAVWEKRAELVAVSTQKSAPRHLDIWELLPRTNCKQCGEATCLAFAVALLQEKQTLEECSIIRSDSNFVDRRAALKSMLPTS